MNSNIDPKEGYTETHTGRIARPTTKVAPKLASPTIPAKASETQSIKKAVNPLETKPVISEGKKSSETVSVAMVKEPKNGENATPGLRMTPPNLKLNTPKTLKPQMGEPVTAPIVKPAAVGTAAVEPVTVETASSESATATVKLRKTPEAPASNAQTAPPTEQVLTSANQTVKLKPASSSNNTSKIKTTVQSKTVKMKAVSDVKEEKATSIAPPQPFEEEGDDQPGTLLALVKIASVAVACAAIYFSVVSYNLIGLAAK